MLARDLLEAVKARALRRDLLASAVLTLLLLGLFAFLYGLLDYIFSFSRPVRLTILLTALLTASAGLFIAPFLCARRRDLLWAASRVEQAIGSLNNELIVMAESLTRHDLVPSYMSGRLEARLSPKLSSIEAGKILPFRPSRKMLALSSLVFSVFLLLFALFPGPAIREFERLILLQPGSIDKIGMTQAHIAGSGAVDTRLVEEIRVRLTPPAYTSREALEQSGEGNITALAGTRVSILINAARPLSGASILLGGAKELKMKSGDGLLHTASFVINEDSSYKVIAEAGGDPAAKWEGLYAIKLIKDGPPQVNLVHPSSDILFHPNQVPASISVRVRARDEFGIASIKLRYIKVTGEGDASRFESGEVSVRAESRDGMWSGAVNLDLKSLGLEPGSSLVLHAEATDNNSFTGPSRGYSESIVLQVAEPKKVRIEVDNLEPDELLKYLTSQRMILIKTERLHRIRNRISREDLLARSQQIALEQRRFRESFYEFTELEPAHDHEGEADEHEDEADAEGHNATLPEIPAGGSERVRAMIMALRAMWRAESELQVAMTDAAIEFEKDALSHLKIAQKGARHMPLIAARSKPIDLKRRYQGRLDEIRDRLETVKAVSPDPVFNHLGSIMTALYDAARALAKIDDKAADRVNRIQRVAHRFDKLSDEILQVRGTESTALVNSAAVLKLLSRMVNEAGGRQGESSDERLRIVKLIADLSSQLTALMHEGMPTGTTPASQSLSPSASSKGASYFKLLSK